MTEAKKPRASVLKVRTGCITCKIRRVKCDERKPSCQRCTSTGRKCDGYDPTFTKVKYLQDPERVPPFQVTTVYYSIPFKIPGSQQDRQLFHYYCAQAAAELSGFSGSEFWNRLVLQRSHHEPVIRRALIALSSMHQDFGTKGGLGDEFDGPSCDTLLEYNKSIRLMRKYLVGTKKPSEKIILICCALFYYFEAARGEYEAALGHLQSGLVILRTWVAQRTESALSELDPSLDEEFEDLLQMFMKMDIQASIFNDTRTPLLLLMAEGDVRYDSPAVQPIFDGIRAAKIAYDKLENHIVHFVFRSTGYKRVPRSDVPPEVIRQRVRLEERLEKWFAAFGVLIRQGQKEPCREALVLVLCYRCLKIVLLTSIPTENGMPLDLQADFEDIIRLSESYLISQGQQAHRIFSSETEFIAPLYMTMVKSRDPHQRKRSMALLKLCRRREGLMDSELVVKTAERLITLETRVNRHVHETEYTALEDYEFAEYYSVRATGGLNDLYRLLGAQL